MPDRDIRICHEYSNEELGEIIKEREKKMPDRADIPGIATIKIKKQILMTATRCLVCGKLECPEFNHELYDAVIMGETSGICESCRKAIEWAKEQMESR